MSERWLPVIGYEGYYEVSDQGRVRSVDRIVTQVSHWGTPSQRRLRGQIIRPTRFGRSAHVSVDLSVGGRRNRKRRQVHTLVLEAFVGPCPDGLEGCHWNDIGDDNRLANLRWDTRSANQLDKVRNGRHHYAKRTECVNGHEFTEQNIRLEGGDNARHCRECERDRRAKTAEQHQNYKRIWRAQRRAEGKRAS